MQDCFFVFTPSFAFVYYQPAITKPQQLSHPSMLQSRIATLSTSVINYGWFLLHPPIDCYTGCMTHPLDPFTPDQTQAARLAHLAEEIIAAKLCPELAAQATQLVLGDGNPNADIVFVGEAPGKNEDLQGKPFVGAAGKFLDEMLATAGLVRSDVYITNIVKYRPPNNRDPLLEEKRAFWPYLMQQLDIIQPKAVLTLGRHSGGGFIPDLRISRDHGQPRKVRLHEREFVVIPLYHPAAALYNGAMRQTLIDDFVRAVAYVQQATQSK